MEILVHLIEGTIFIAIVWMTVRVMALYKRNKGDDLVPVLETPAFLEFETKADETDDSAGNDPSSASHPDTRPALRQIHSRGSRGSRADCMAQVHLIWRQQLLDWRQQDMDIKSLYHPSLTRLVEHYIGGIVQAVGQHYDLPADTIEQIEAHAVEGCLHAHIKTDSQKQPRVVGSEDDCQRFYLAGFNHARQWLNARQFSESDSLFACVTDWGLVA